VPFGMKAKLCPASRFRAVRVAFGIDIWNFEDRGRGLGRDHDPRSIDGDCARRSRGEIEDSNQRRKSALALALALASASPRPAVGRSAPR